MKVGYLKKYDMNICRIPQEKLDFINKNHAKYTIKEIADLVDYDRGTLYAYYTRKKLSYIKIERNTQVSELDKELIIEFLYTHKNNTNSNIAKVFGLKKEVVSNVIKKHSDKKMKRINKRKYKDIEWGKL